MLGLGGVWRGLGSIPPILMDVLLELHVSSGMVLWSVVWSIVLGVCVCVYVCGYVCVCVCVCGWGGEGGYFNDSWVGMHRWYPKTLSSAGIRPNSQNLSLSYIRYFPETTEVDTLFDIKPSYREINFVL